MNLPEYIHRRRSELMGCAILLIICFHSYISLPLPLWKYVVRSNGNMGVDFFVFLAGFGCAFSLKKNPDIGAYFSRRMKRLLPPYYAALVLFFLAAGLPDLDTLLGMALPISIWIGYGGAYWYISASVLYYLLVPALMCLMENARWPRIMFLALMGCFSLAVPYITRAHGPAIAIMRLPALVAGTAMGVFYHSHHRRRDWWIDALLLALIYAAGVVLLRHRRLLVRYPFAIIDRSQINRLRKVLRAPMIITAAALVLEGIEKTPLRFVNAFLRFAGRHTLGLYLGHVIARYIALHALDLANWRLLLFLLTASWPVALAIEWGGKWLLKLAGRLMRPVPARPGGE